MARNAQEVTEAELAVLKVLWETGTATCRRIVEELYPDGTAASYATVQKLLERLEMKEFVRRDRSAHVHLFSSRVPRTELIGRGLRALALRSSSTWLPSRWSAGRTTNPDTPSRPTSWAPSTCWRRPARSGACGS